MEERESLETATMAQARGRRRGKAGVAAQWGVRIKIAPADTYNPIKDLTVAVEAEIYSDTCQSSAANQRPAFTACSRNLRGKNYRAPRFSRNDRSCQTIRDLVRLAVGPLRLSNVPQSVSIVFDVTQSQRSQNILFSFDCSLRSRHYSKTSCINPWRSNRRNIAFKSMLDCEQSNIHLGATTIGSAERASDDRKIMHHFR